MAPKSIISGDNVPKLIREVCNHESLWNPQDPNYTDRVHSMATWKAIAWKLGMSADVCKTKWKNLRDLFRRETKKWKVTRLEDYPGRWRFYKLMWFLTKAGIFFNINDLDKDSLEVEIDGEDLDVDEEINSMETFVKMEPTSDADDDRLDDYENEVPTKKMKYTEDAYDLMYLQSLTPYFSQLQPLRKLIVRSKIQDILLNEIEAQNSTDKLRDEKEAKT